VPDFAAQRKVDAMHAKIRNLEAILKEAGLEVDPYFREAGLSDISRLSSSQMISQVARDKIDSSEISSAFIRNTSEDMTMTHDLDIVEETEEAENSETKKSSIQMDGSINSK
jgi:pentose-5-phosphate-3-epimerase